MDIVLYALTVALYAGLSIYAWKQGQAFEKIGKQGSQTFLSESRQGRSSKGEQLVLLCAWLSHGVLLHETVFPPDHMVFGFAHALSAMLWLGVATYWVESWFFPLNGLRFMLLSTATWVSALPIFFPSGRVVAHAANPLFKLHFLVANMAYGLLTLAAFHALLMMALDQRLHHPSPVSDNVLQRWKNRLLDSLPPLLTLEKILFRLIGAGFICLTLTIFTGSVFSEELFGIAFQWNHKVIFSIISWLMFGSLLLGRRILGWRGQQALRFVLASFGFLLLAYVGSRFVMEVLLHRV